MTTLLRPWRKRPSASSKPDPARTTQTGRTGNKPPLYVGQSKINGGPIVFSGEGSLLTVGPPGTGKSRGVAVWNLLDYPGSMLVTDPKGQLAQWSAAHRAEHLGQEIAVLDPFGLTGWRSVSVNPFAALIKAGTQGQGARTEADRIAHLLLPDLAGSQDPFWRSGARDLIMTGLLYLAALKPERCDPPGLQELLWLKQDVFLKDVLDPMDRSGILALRQYAGDMADNLDNHPKTFGFFRKEARQAMAIFAGDEPCGRACRHSDIDLARLIQGRLTVYLVLPPQYVASHGRWMGLIAADAIHGIMRERENGECVFLLDEFPNLGRLPGIHNAIAQLREKGLRVWSFVQDLAQLESVYGKADAEAMRNQAEVLQVLGCRSVELANYIEKRAGTFAAADWTVNLPDPGREDAGPSRSVKEIGDPVLPASKALNMEKGTQILIRHGKPVIEADINIWTGG